MHDPMDVDQAATVIQTYFRGYQARKEYVKRLLNAYEKEEDQRREKELIQVWEGEILIERHRLLHDINDSKTVFDNEQRKLNTMVIRIQRAWREKLLRRNKTLATETLNDVKCNGSRWITLKDNKASISEECDRYADGVHEKKILQTVSFNEVVNGSHESELLFSENKCSNVEMDSKHQQNGCVEMQNCMKIEKCEDTSHTKATYGEKQSPPLTECSTDHSDSNFGTSCSRSFAENAAVPVVPSKQIELDLDHRYSLLPRIYSHSHSPNETDLIVSESQKGAEPDTFATHADKYRLCYTLELSGSSNEDEGRNELKCSSTSEVLGQMYETPHSESPVQQTTVWNNCDDPLQSLMFVHKESPYCDRPDNIIDSEDLKWNEPHCQDFEVPQLHDSPKHATNIYCHNHSNSPIHSMTVDQLQELLQLLEVKLKASSKVLVMHLEERELLQNQNHILHINIAKITRKLQQLHTSLT